MFSSPEQPGRTQRARLRDLQDEAALGGGGDEKETSPQRHRSRTVQLGQSVLEGDVRFFVYCSVVGFFLVEANVYDGSSIVEVLWFSFRVFSFRRETG